MSKITVKPILPSLREKKRYVVFQVISEKKLNFNDIKEEANKAILQFLGEYGYARAGIIMLDDFKNNKFIIRTNNKETDKVKTALALIEKIKNERVIVKSVGISGILKKAREKFMLNEEV